MAASCGAGRTTAGVDVSSGETVPCPGSLLDEGNAIPEDAVHEAVSTLKELDTLFVPTLGTVGSGSGGRVMCDVGTLVDKGGGVAGRLDDASPEMACVCVKAETEVEAAVGLRVSGARADAWVLGGNGSDTFSEV
eukprot:1319562-Rhodomonas_salina.2